jgi:hypothetical protein
MPPESKLPAGRLYVRPRFHRGMARLLAGGWNLRDDLAGGDAVAVLPEWCETDVDAACLHPIVSGLGRLSDQVRHQHLMRVMAGVVSHIPGADRGVMGIARGPSGYDTGVVVSAAGDDPHNPYAHGDGTCRCEKYEAAVHLAAQSPTRSPAGPRRSYLPKTPNGGLRATSSRQVDRR